MERTEDDEARRDDALPRFQAIYEAHYAAVVAYVRRRTRVPADAQDAVAETFTTAWRRVAEVPEGDAGRAWLYGVARRVLANQRRGDRRRTGLTIRLRSEDEGAVDVEGPVLAADDRRIVLAALARLREADREILRLAVWEELPHREIGAVLGCAESAVAVRLHRARNRLAREIGKEERRAGQETSESPGRRAEGSTS